MDDLFTTIGHRFGRVEPRRRMRDYVRGLLAPVARKNSWQLAEHAGHLTPDGLQHLLSRARWNPDDIRDDLQTYVAEQLGRPDGVLVVDDTGFLKKGTTSAGVQRQYSGTAGARISISARQRGVGGSLRYDPVSVRPRCHPCSAD
ncbi:transposase (plasmid) [Streptomyces sp. NBC_01450]|uniref:transposase n=1 Tax=Streptomyces sp. NBC_01450 TaxID=2903871 RepID=UPI002E368DD0|nr:transposase [Streptomyces sp. NBC_01450]